MPEDALAKAILDSTLEQTGRLTLQRERVSVPDVVREVVGDTKQAHRPPVVQATDA